MSEENKEINVRQNPFCVISKETFGDYEVHDIQTNSAWQKNPYVDTYVTVPDEMVPGVVETCGFCDIELNKDETELVSYTAREIPEIEEETPEDESVSWDSMAEAIQKGVDEV